MKKGKGERSEVTGRERAALSKAKAHKLARLEAAKDAALNALERVAEKASATDARWRAERDNQAKASRKAASRKMGKGKSTVWGGYGGFDRVERVADPVAGMASRGQIEPRDKAAAEIYRRAFDVLHGSVGGAMNPDKVGGGGTPTTVADHLLTAAGKISEADRILGVTDGLAIRLVVGEGRSIGEATQTMRGSQMAHEQRVTGARVREGLRALADVWLPEHRGRGIRAHMDEDARPDLGEAGAFERLPVAHAGPAGATYQAAGSRRRS